MWTMQNGEACVLFIKCHVVAGTDIMKYDAEWHLVMKIHPLKCKLVNCPFEVWVLKPTFVPLPLPHFFWWKGQMFLMDFERTTDLRVTLSTHSFLLFHFTFCFLMRLTFISLSPEVWDFIISLPVFELRAVFLTHIIPSPWKERKKTTIKHFLLELILCIMALIFINEFYHKPSFPVYLWWISVPLKKGVYAFWLPCMWTLESSWLRSTVKAKTWFSPGGLLIVFSEVVNIPCSTNN